MTSKEITNKLKEMRLSTMAEALQNQLDDPDRYKDADFLDRLGLMVDVEYANRKSNKITRLIKSAGFDQPTASIMDINYESGRKLNKDLIMKIAGGGYLAEALNVFITGATGGGKTYLSNAFGIEACKMYYTTKYIRMPDLFIEADIARAEKTYDKMLSKYTKPKLLIIDEWLLLKPSEDEQRVIFDLLHKRRKHSSTIFCSQYHKSEWYEQLGGDASPLADAIIDRIIHDGYEINITSIDPNKDISMREVYGLKSEEAADA